MCKIGFFLLINESYTYPPIIGVIISYLYEIRFWNSYLPTFLQVVMKYPVLFFWQCPLAKELLEVAEEYQLQKLKELCELKLSSSVDIGNCIDLLVLSDINQASTLKTAALNFVNKNLKQIEISELKTKLSDSPSLLVKVLEKNLQEEDFDVSAKKKIKLS